MAGAVTDTMQTPRTPARLAVTGATGAVGGAVARALAAEGVPLRLVVRDASRAPDLPGAEVAVASYADGDAAEAALRGVEVLFMVSAGEAVDRLDQHRTFVDAAVRAGVRHVVYTSFQGAGPDAVFTLGRDHGATEQHLVASGVGTTFLRDSFYLDSLVEFVDEAGVLRGPAGEGRVAAVARADVAAVAAAVLRDPEAHRGATYDVTGGEALTLSEVAARLSAATGRPVTYAPETVEEAYASRQAWDPEPWQADAWVSTYTAMAAGEVSTVSTTVRDLTGRAPLRLEDVVAG
ncbi:SDR family oxidoreductase [Frigoribacterium salinisoli]